MFPEIKNYTIVREIGTGGMAVVYEAVDNRLHRTVAIKVLHPHLGKEPAASERFIREACAAAKIDHPNVVRIYDYGSIENLHYIIMEYVPGITLEKVLKEQASVTPDNACAIMYEIAEALEQAHTRGIIHRDIKPANILLHKQGRAMLSDFGLAHYLPDPRLTAEDAVAGTPSFMSPEQIAGKTLSMATDIYSWGVCFYTLIAGDLPYRSQKFPDIIGEIRRGAIQMNSGLIKNLPSRYAAILYRCLTADPEQRIGDAAELIRLLDIANKNRPVCIDMSTLPAAAAPDTGEPAASSSSTGILKNNDKRGMRPGLLAAIVIVALAGSIGIFSGLRLSDRQPAAGKAVRQNRSPVAFELARSDSGVLPAAAGDTLLERVGHSVGSTVGESDGSRPLQRKAVSVAAIRNTEEQQLSDRATERLPPTPAVPAIASSATSPPPVSPDSGKLFVHCNPWAAVRVDSVDIGTTPFAEPLVLPVGAHVITLSNSYCEPQTDTVTIAAGTIVRKRYNLKVRSQ